MKRTTFFLSLSVFAMVVFLFVPSVPGQGEISTRPGLGLVQSDYDNYARLFKSGFEPNLSPATSGNNIGNERWRALYRSHRWAEHAAGGEFREPMLAAQTLMGIYKTQNIDHRLSYQIETIIMNKAYMGASLAERIVLDRMVDYWTRATSDENSATYDPELKQKLDAVAEGDEFFSEYELEMLAIQKRDIDRIARTRIVNPRGISIAMQAEVRSVRNLFDQGESYKNWVLTYYFMREKFDILDALADRFTFNWDEKRKATEVQTMMSEALTDPVLRANVEVAVRLEAAASERQAATAATSSDSGMSDSESSSGETYDEYGEPIVAQTRAPAMSAQEMALLAEQQRMAKETDIQQKINARLVSEAVANFRQRELRESAYQYIFGVYESTQFHLGELRTIHRYFSNAAAAGDPIAQYHLSLFLKYLGEIVDPFTDEATRESEIERLWAAAELSDITKGRVEKLREQIATEVRLKTRRAQVMEARLESLWKVENDKIDLFNTVLMGVRERISSGSGVGGRMGGNMMSGGMMGGDYGGSSGSGRSGSRSGSSSRSSRNSSSSDSSE